MELKSCVFKGHRPRKFPRGYNEADAKCIALKKALAGEIAKLVDAGYTEFFSGMAEVTGAWAAMTVLAVKKENPTLRLHCVLPCEGQAEEWTASARELYKLQGNDCDTFADKIAIIYFF